MSKIFKIQCGKKIDKTDKNSWYYRLGLHSMTDGDKMEHYFTLPCSSPTPAPMPTDGYLFIDPQTSFIYLVESDWHTYTFLEPHRPLTKRDALIFMYAHRAAWDAGYYSAQKRQVVLLQKSIDDHEVHEEMI